MAENGDPDFHEDAHAQHLVRDPAAPPRAVAFVGLLGRSHREGYARLYLDEGLRDWFEIALADILYVEQAEENDPRSLVGSILWVDQYTRLDRKRAQPEDLQGEFVSGELATETVPQAAMIVYLDVTVGIITWWKSPKVFCPRRRLHADQRVE
jgi:hypothetical protein